MTVYTFALGLVFWGAHSSPTQRAIAAASLGGLVPIVLSQHSLRREQPVGTARLGGAAPRHPSLLRLSTALGCAGLLSATRATHDGPHRPRQPEPTKLMLHVMLAAVNINQARPLPHVHGVARRVACLDPVSRGGLARTHVQRLV